MMSLIHLAATRPGRSALLLLAALAWGHTTLAATTEQLQKIEHVIILYAENRSFDNLYGMFPGADGVSNARFEQLDQIDNDGTSFVHLPPAWGWQRQFPTLLPNRPIRLDAPPFNQPLNTKIPDLVHRYYQHLEQLNGGKLNRYAAVSDRGGLVMGYYDGSKLRMWKYAQAYTLCDRFFMGAFGGSFLNHFWLICAATPVFPDAPPALRAELAPNGLLQRAPGSPLSALDGPPAYVRDGAVTPDGFAINTNQPPYQPSGIRPEANGDPARADSAGLPLPPQTMKTIGDTLTAKGISWAWYAGAWDDALKDGMQPPSERRNIIYNSGKDSPNFQAHHQPFNYFQRFAPGTADRAEHLMDGNKFVAGIKSGQLPQVSFYKPQGNLNEHPGYADVISGDEHIAGLVDQIVGSALWPGALIIVTYDENGGLWDHVPPPKGDRWGPGARIPAIIISPFARRGFVDSSPYDTTSILKFLTVRYNLEPLPGVRASAGDLTGALTFP